MTEAIPYDDRCFACNPKAAVGEDIDDWPEPRAACVPHKMGAVFASGLTVRQLHATGRADGSLLNYMVGPVLAGGRRGWLSYAAGGVALFEERFQSHRFVEWLLQHDSVCLGWLHRIHENARQLLALPTDDPFALLKLGVDLVNAVGDCVVRWDIGRRAEPIMARGGISTLEGADDLIPERLEHPLGPNLGADIRALVALAARRFARNVRLAPKEQR